ncbi:ArnT family glycosyltransferase [Luteibacter sp.]|uniref:ArnT family glycosyltransferase n=1 Tax=Luteibacter sp. TaxID=1886636 RepID=UPI003F7EFCF4
MNDPTLLFPWLRDRPWVIAFLWMIPALLLPSVPIDETRYLSIAWEMRRSGEVFGLTLNGQPYMDKSPLLFWLVNVAWTLFGVSTASARIVCIALAASAVATVTSIARRFGLQDATSAGWVLLPFVLFGAFTPIAMFDVPLLFFVTLGFLGLVRWVQGEVVYGVATFIVAGICGLLAKGPVYLLHMLGPMLFVRWWLGRPLEKPWRLAAGLSLSLVIALVPLAAWAIASATRIQGVPLVQSLTHQSVGRVAHSFAHQRSMWWYLPWIAPFLLPWACLVRVRELPVAARQTLGTGIGRFAVAAFLPALVLFSLISGKQIHYLLPLLPGAALFISAMARHAPSAFAFHRASWLLAAAALAWAWPVANSVIGMQGNASWYVAALASATLLSLGALATRSMGARPGETQLRIASVAALLAAVSAELLFGGHAKAHMDPQELADAVKDFQRRGVVVAAVVDEPGMITYLARLPRPLPRIEDERAWIAANPGGFALVHASRGPAPSYALAAVTLADGWEGLVPAGRLREVHP